MKIRASTLKLWIPLAIFLFLAGGFSGVWWMNRRHGEKLLETQCRIIASQSASRLEEAVRVRLALVEQLRAEWLLQPYTDRESFRRRVQPILDQFPGYLAINWIDQDGIIRWVVPPEPNWKAVGKDLHTHASAAATFRAAEADGSDRVTPPITLYQGGLGLAAYFPIRDKGRNMGYLNGVFRIEPLVRGILGSAILQRYAIRIASGTRTVFTNGRVPLPGWRRRVRSQSFPVGRTTWALSVLPVPGTSPVQRRLVNVLLLLAGLIFAAAIAVLARQALLAHDRVRSSEARYRDLFERSMDAIYVSTPEGRFLDCNEAAVRLFGAKDRSQLLETDIGTDLYQEPAERRHIMHALERDGSVQDYPLRLKTLDGSPIFARVSETVIRNPDGTIASIQGILHDETEARRMHEELVRVQRLESMSDLAGGIAHDFNNVLAAIMANAAMLELGLDDPAKRLYTQRIEASVKSASRLTGQLLEFSRGSLQRIDLVDLNRLASETLLMLERSIDPNIVVRQHFAEDLPPVKGDPGRLQQILLNLLVNARDALPHGGTITVETARSQPPSECTEPGVSPAESSSRGWVRISVSDTGHGMDDRTLKRIFEPFFTTKGRRKGTGLGLAVAYGVVRDHGGSIQVESSPGRGTTFRVLLPAASGQAATPRPTTEGEVTGGTATILVVDDDPDVRLGLVAILASAGYRVLEAEDGLVALDIFRREHAVIDAVLLDMTMPGPDGIETMRSLRKIAPAIRIVLSTGYSEGGWDLDVDQPDAFLHKPYGRTLLLRTLQEVLDPGHDAR